MRTRSKLTIASFTFLAALVMTYDAYAGNLRSAATPSVLYWFATATPDVELYYSGGSTSGGQPSMEPPVVLIDDIIYTGKIEPGEDPIFLCRFHDQCSFWKPNDPNDMEDPGTLDFGPLFNHDNNQNQMIITNFPTHTEVARFDQFDQAQTDVTTKTRGWEHRIVVSIRDDTTTWMIDQLNLIGSNTIAVKERREIFGQMSNVTVLEPPEDPEGSGDSGLGLGIGVGVGATSFMLNTTAHRAYQTPYILDGDQRILIQSVNWFWARVVLHGRIVPEENEFPTVVNMSVALPQ